MNIPRIQLSNTKNAAEDPVVQQPGAAVNETPLKKRWKKFSVPKNSAVIASVICSAGLIIAGGVWAIGSFVQWDDGGEEQSDIRSSRFVSAKPVTISGQASDENEESSSGSVTVKGKITVHFTRERGEAFTGASIKLIHASSGTLYREISTGNGGTAVFDEVPAGSYRVEAGKKGEDRVAKETVNLGAGEITSVSLALFLDTNVSITVTVTGPGGSPIADQDLEIVRDKGEEGLEVVSVHTNGNGAFSHANVPPDGNWMIRKDGSVVGSFAVVPNGQHQSFHVQASSN